jgi:hypothetical protein
MNDGRLFVVWPSKPYGSEEDPDTQIPYIDIYAITPQTDNLLSLSETIRLPQVEGRIPMSLSRLNNGVMGFAMLPFLDIEQGTIILEYDERDSLYLYDPSNDDVERVLRLPPRHVTTCPDKSNAWAPDGSAHLFQWISPNYEHRSWIYIDNRAGKLYDLSYEVSNDAISFAWVERDE